MMKEPQIEVYLDGKRPSIVSGNNAGEVFTKVWTDGQQGEDIDYFPDHCDGVTATINTIGSGVHATTYLTGLTTVEAGLLKACLGPSDFDSANNVDIQNWDLGSIDYPHMIKLIQSVTTMNDGGYYAAIYYDGTHFVFVNPFYPPSGDVTDNFEIYTTAGTLARVSNHSEAAFLTGSNQVISFNYTGDESPIKNHYTGDVSCEINNHNDDKMAYISHCLNKGDLITFLSFDTPVDNPRHINLYQVERLITVPDWVDSTKTPWDLTTGRPFAFGTHQITTDISLNWGHIGFSSPDSVHFYIYKFFPAESSNYEYVAQCSNRGLCNTDEGLCDCFAGYTGDACQEQSSLAV